MAALYVPQSTSETGQKQHCQPSKYERTNTTSRGGGFECNFLERPPRAIQTECPVCLQILCEPYQVTCCGYSFCKTCIEQIQADKKNCPTCNREQITIFSNKGLQRSLYEFHVYCTHKQQGCEWTGELGQLDKHLNFNPQPDKQLEGCQYSEIECQFCHNLIQRHTITPHQADLCPKRPFSCEYCHNYPSDYDDVIHNHWRMCGFHPVRCPYECGRTTLRQNLQTHITNECSLTVIDCDFHHVGCDVKLPRKDMPTHLKENLVTHTSLQAASHSKLLQNYHEIHQDNQRLKHQISKLQTENSELKRTFQQQIANLETSHIATTDQLQRKITNLERYARAHTDEYNQLQQEIVRLRKEVQVLPTLPTIPQEHQPGVPHTYMHIGMPGHVKFSMNNFEQHKRDNDEWSSLPFYTHNEGYKMCLCVTANGYGDGKGTHVTVCVCILRGEFDDHLKWPFRGDITVQLLNQERNEEHYLDLVTFDHKVPNTSAGRAIDRERNYTWGKNKYIAHERLKPNFLKNDSLCFQITNVELH